MSGSQWFALAVGLTMLGANVWLALRRPRTRTIALMGVMGGAVGFQVVWAALFYQRGGLWEVPVYLVPLVPIAVIVAEVRRSRSRRDRPPPPGSAPPSPGP